MLNQVQSSRRLEREAQRNVELMWLTGRLAPDFKTIADFRKDHGDAIRKVCREFILLCRRLRLFADGVIAIDGSKFKVVDNRDKNFTSHKIQVRMQQLEHSINRYLAELDRADRDPAVVLPERVARLKEKIAKIKEQRRGLGEIDQQLQATQERQISMTDPDARSMATSCLGSAVVGYNVQTAVDAKHHLIVAHDRAPFTSPSPHRERTPARRSYPTPDAQRSRPRRSRHCSMIAHTAASRMVGGCRR
jgi:polyhydroxyalkanoate synthesis regulator phasin